MATKTWLSAAETAKIVRTVLKAVFPEVKFSVRSETYSGGASIRIGWTDGPTTKRVDAIAKRFQGASFDGMIDLKSYHDSEWQGQQVHFGADYVFTNRKVSLALLAKAAAQVAQQFGTSKPRIIMNTGGYEPYLDPKDPLTYSHPGTNGGNYGRNFQDLVWGELQEMEG